MDARKVHELLFSHTKQNTGSTAPVNQNIDFTNPANSLNQNPKPVQSRSNIDGVKWGRIFFVGGALLVTYLLLSTPRNNTSTTIFQRRKLREKESSDKDKGQ